ALRPAVISTVVFISGFCALFYEVLWTRALNLIVGSSTRAFSLMLATFLFGLSVGIALAGWITRSGRRSPFILFLVQCGVGISALGTTILLPQLPRWFLELYVGNRSEPTLFLLWQALLCALILFVPALLMGSVFPLALDLLPQSENSESEQVGWLYALNTVACIGGAFVAGTVFIPWLGLQRSLLFGVWVNLALAA